MWLGKSARRFFLLSSGSEEWKSGLCTLGRGWVCGIIESDSDVIGVFWSR
jgi:hypothetical protein